MEQIHIQENCLNSNLNNVDVDQGWWKEQATDWSTCNIYSEGGYHKTSNKCPPTFITPWGLEPQHLLETRHLIEHWPRAPWVYYVICSGFMLSYSSCYFSVLTSIYLFLKKTGITCANTKYLGSYDVTNVWLVLWQLCVTSQARNLFETRRMLETHHLLEHRPRTRGIY